MAVVVIENILEILEKRKVKKVVAQFSSSEKRQTTLKTTATSMFKARIFQEIMEELKRRKIVEKGDTMIMDNGFYAYRDYLIGVNEYRSFP